jgi:hypothetical protein
VADRINSHIAKPCGQPPAESTPGLETFLPQACNLPRELLHLYAIQARKFILERIRSSGDHKQRYCKFGHVEAIERYAVSDRHEVLTAGEHVAEASTDGIFYETERAN